MVTLRPDQEVLAKDVYVWDADRGVWDYGERRDFVVAMPLYRWDWINVQGGCLDEPPFRDFILLVEFCESIYLMCSTIGPNTVGANTDFNVETSPDGVNWDTVPFATINLGANATASMLVQPGMKYIRMRIDNNAQDPTDAWAICKRLK